MSKYRYTEDMDEISGFGGGYEAACRRMVVAGLEWLDEHPDANINYKTLKGVYGITFDESDDTRRMQEAMIAAAGEGGVTGAMMQACLSHILWIKSHSWEEYQMEMRRRGCRRAEC